MIDPYGYLSNYSNAITPPLLDLVMQNETGHIPLNKRFTPYATSNKGALGGYQLRGKHLHDLGYGMKPYVQSDALDPVKSRDIAGKFIKGYSDHYGFKNVADTLIGYNMGAKATKDWIDKGSKYTDLPDETKAYLKRAMDYMKNNPEQYSLEKINQEITEEVSNDNLDFDLSEQEGIIDMYRPSLRQQNTAQNFIDGVGREARLQGGDPYSEGYGYIPPALASMQNNQRGGILNASVDDGTNSDEFVTRAMLANRIKNNLANPDRFQGEIEDIYSEGYGFNPIDNSTNTSTNNGILNSNFMSQPVAREKRRDRQDLSKGVRYPEGIPLHEMLIRIGGAGLANSHLGGNRQTADATAMYGNIMDYNRGQALKKYNIDMAKAKKTAKQARADADYLGNIDQSLADMDRALMGLKDGGVTGLWDGTVGSFLDSMTGDPKETTRLLLQKLKVDDTLLRIAQTKGAISNKEMDLFMSPAPKVGFHDEEVWKTWINDRKVALQRIKARLTGNMQVVDDQQASQNQVNSFTSNGIIVKQIK